MKLQIQQTLGIINAEIDMEPGRIVEVVGPNASGKTSIAVCAQAVLARESNPLGLSAADAKKSYPHDGADDARVSLLHTSGNGTAEWFPARGTLAANDDAMSHPSAVGLIDFTAKRGAKERAAVFQSALLPDPDTVMAAIKERLGEYLDAQDLAGAMEMLAERGWEATEAVYADRGRTAKREWNTVTGRTYGVRVAADWRPDGWLADFDHMTVQIAEQAVTDARDALNALHRVQAVTEAEQETAERAAADLPGLEVRLMELQEKHRTLTSDRDAIPLLTLADEKECKQRELGDLQRERGTHRECPHCQGSLSLDKGNIVAGRQPQEMESAMTVLQNEIHGLENRCDELNKKRNPIIRQLKDLDVEIRDQQSRVSICKREASQTGAVQTEADRAALAQSEQAVEDAREVVRLVKAEADATRLHQTIIRYTEIARALGPEGVRAKMLEKGMAKLNAGLRVIADASGWPLVQVADSGSITHSPNSRFGLPMALASESERWRAQAAIQLTLGAITGSKAVVLDRADLLDPANRDGLVCAVNRVVGRTGMAVLLCSTGTVAADAPWQQVAVKDGVTA